MWLAAAACARPAAAEPAEPLLRYAVWAAEPASADRAFRVAVHADGRVELHRPAHFRAAGDFLAQVEEAQALRLVEALRALGVADFDPVEVAASAERAALERRARDGTVHASSEIVTTEFVLAGVTAGATPKRVVVENLQWQAGLYPQVEALARLAQAEQRIRQFVDTLDAIAVPVPVDTGEPSP
jgi:hypothetical protein